MKKIKQTIVLDGTINYKGNLKNIEVEYVNETFSKVLYLDDNFDSQKDWVECVNKVKEHFKDKSLGYCITLDTEILPLVIG